MFFFNYCFATSLALHVNMSQFQSERHFRSFERVGKSLEEIISGHEASDLKHHNIIIYMMEQSKELVAQVVKGNYPGT